MYFSDLEYIQHENESVIVRSQTKEEVLGKLEHEMMTYITEIDDRVRYENETDSAILRGLSICPIVLNAFANRGHKNVLFVGHYDQGKSRNWVNNDQNLIYQLLPIIHKEYGYDFHLTLAAPPKGKHRGTMWYLYDKFQLLRLPCTKQYVHGMMFKLSDLPRPEDRFDAIIFAGVPLEDENFSVTALRNVWKKWCTEDFEMYDIFDGERTLKSSKDSQSDLVKAFSLRSESDHMIGNDVDLQIWKSETFDKLKSDIRIF